MDRPENELPDRERPDRNPEDRRDWETIQQNEADYTQRLRIVGGYLYRTVLIEESAVGLVFVPMILSDDPGQS